MLTQKQIAGRLGLAQITVSRVLNHHPSVKPATRARVLAALGRGYALNVNARNLVLGRSGRLALVIPGADAFQSPFLPLVMAGIAEESRRRHYAAFFINMQGIGQLADLAGELQGADAAVVFNFSQMRPFLKPLLRAMERRRQPYVLAQSHGGGAGPVLSVDNVQGGELAARHLLELGHRRVAFIGGARSQESAERRRGFDRELRRAGLAMRPEWLLKVDGFAGIPECARALHSARAKGPTAVFVYSDRVALGLIYELLKCGWRVPQDISVIGFNDFQPFVTMFQPHITTVRQPLHELGVAAVRMALDGAPPPQRRLLPTNLVVRASTRAV